MKFALNKLVLYTFTNSEQKEDNIITFEKTKKEKSHVVRC